MVSMEKKVRKLEKKLERRKCVEHPTDRRNLKENNMRPHTCRFVIGVLIVSEALERRLLTGGRAWKQKTRKIPRFLVWFLTTIS